MQAAVAEDATLHAPLAPAKRSRTAGTSSPSPLPQPADIGSGTFVCGINTALSSEHNILGAHASAFNVVGRLVSE